MKTKINTLGTALLLIATASGLQAAAPKLPKPVPIDYVGAFNPIFKYTASDLVSYNGIDYLATNTIPAGISPGTLLNYWTPLTFVGPQGPTGPQGPQGPRGAQGSQGIQGIQGPAGTSVFSAVVHAFADTNTTVNEQSDATVTVGGWRTDFDTSGGGFNPTNGVFTATTTTAGIYLVTAKVLFNYASWSAGQFTSLVLQKNENTVSELDDQVVQASYNGTLALHGADTVDLQPGDFISIAVYQNAGTQRSLYNGLYVQTLSIIRVGD